MHAAADIARECCGLLLGRGRRIEEARRAANVAADPARAFEVDPGVLIAAHRAARADGLEVVGCYHSHPSGVAEPSARDVEMAAGDGMLWVIVARDEVTGWVSGAEGFEAVELMVGERADGSKQAQTSTVSA